MKAGSKEKMRNASSTNQPLSAAPKQLKQGDLNVSVYQRLKDMILAGRLRPGNRLVHQDLADQLSVSRTPVREALERLCQEGYAGRRPRRGYFVAELGTSDVQPLYETREALEAFALQRAFEMGFSRTHLNELKKINKRYAALFREGITRERLQIDQEFHIQLASCCNNPVLSGMLISIFEKINLKRRLDGAGLQIGDGPLKDHQALLTAIEANQSEAAEKILRQHIRQACGRFLKHLEINE